MTPKKGDAAAPPPREGEFDVRFATNDAAKGWDDLSKQEPSNTRWAYDLMRFNAGCCKEGPTTRHHRLRADYATASHGGRDLPQWQIEVTGSGRIWYVIDPDKPVVWIKQAARKHPRETD